MSLYSTHNVSSKFVCLSITNLKYKDHTSFYLLLGDVSLNPGPVQISQAVNTNILETLNKKGLFFSYQYKLFTSKNQ